MTHTSSVEEFAFGVSGETAALTPRLPKVAAPQPPALCRLSGWRVFRKDLALDLEPFTAQVCVSVQIWAALLGKETRPGRERAEHRRGCTVSLSAGAYGAPHGHALDGRTC